MFTVALAAVRVRESSPSERSVTTTSDAVTSPGSRGMNTQRYRSVKPWKSVPNSELLSELMTDDQSSSP